jgi:hypothetical protein
MNKKFLSVQITEDPQQLMIFLHNIVVTGAVGFRFPPVGFNALAVHEEKMKTFKGMNFLRRIQKPCGARR